MKKLFPITNGGFLLSLILVFILGWQLGHRDYVFKWRNFKPEIKIINQKSQVQTNIDFKLFWDTWDLVSRQYIDKSAIDPQKLYYGAIQGMVAAVGDPYTVFLPPQAQKAVKEQLDGAFDGVGIQLGFNKDKHLTVIAPLKGTPADRAGVKAGDLILQIDGKDTAALSLPEAVSFIRGPKGSGVKLTLLCENENKPKDVQIIRDMIVVKTVIFESKTTQSGKTIALIHLSGFGEKTRAEWDEAVSRALSIAPRGVIIDVRNNPGGFLEGAVYMVSEFFDQGVIVLQEDAQGIKTETNAVRSGKMTKLPLVVLINKGSASASEILAGAIQDRKRGTLIGEQSFGKGTIQSAEDLPQGTGIHITTAKWLTPEGRWIHNIGLTPDIKVEAGDDSLDDLQLEKALEVLN